jgi:hypothetical protein
VVHQPDGTLVVLVRAKDGAVPWTRSAAGTWSRGQVVGLLGDLSVAVSPAGHVVAWGNDAAGISTAQRAPTGAWSAPRPLPVGTSAPIGPPVVAVDEQGRCLAAWRTAGGGDSPGPAWWNVSFPGVGWRTPGAVAPEAAGEEGLDLALAGGAGALATARRVVRFDFGQGFRAPLALPTGAREVRVAADGSGGVHVAWVDDEQGAGSAVRYAASRAAAPR